MKKIIELKDRLFKAKDLTIIILFLIIGLMGFLQAINDKPLSSTSIESSDYSSSEGIDTYIPKGFVLIPLEIKNLESLNGLISNKGIVDLYIGDQKKSQLIGTNVKIIRAPLNPNVFAALMTEQESQIFLRFDGPFTVVIKNGNNESNESQKLVHSPNQQIKTNKKENIQYFDLN